MQKEDFNAAKEDLGKLLAIAPRYTRDVYKRQTMEKLSLDNGRLTKETLPMQLNQIARVVLTLSLIHICSG